MSTLERLGEIIREEGDPLASVLRSVPDSVAIIGLLAAAGPRADGDRAEYELLIEAIYEGYLLHYEHSRLLHTNDPNLALLAGDRLYAFGLERLVALGDLEAVRELADVISLCAMLRRRAASRSSAARSGWRVRAPSATGRARPTSTPSS